MPFIAICPYCQKGRVHAPEKALGLTAACPRCQMSFTLVNSGESLEEAQKKSGLRPRPDLPRKSVAAVQQPRQVAAPTPVPGPDTPIAVAEPTDEHEPPLPISTVPFPSVEGAPTGPDPLRAPMLIAFILAGVGLLLAQVPYGRFGTVALTAVGAIIAGACWFAARKPLWPAVATSLNVGVLIVVALLPSWLGLDSWRRKPADKDANTIKSYGKDGVAIASNDWVAATQGWQLGDVRARVRAVTLGPVELTGPNGEKRWSRKHFLQVRVRVGNGGVARVIEFKGWDARTVQLTDSAGRALSLAAFDKGWEGAPRVEPASLPPGRAAEQLFIFEPPAGQTEFLRLELPGSAFGEDQPVRFQIAVSQISRPQ